MKLYLTQLEKNQWESQTEIGETDKIWAGGVYDEIAKIAKSLWGNAFHMVWIAGIYPYAINPISREIITSIKIRI